MKPYSRLQIPTNFKLFGTHTPSAELIVIVDNETFSSPTLTELKRKRGIRKRYLKTCRERFHLS
jgi:hypothetical protein